MLTFLRKGRIPGNLFPGDSFCTYGSVNDAAWILIPCFHAILFIGGTSVFLTGIGLKLTLAESPGKAKTYRTAIIHVFELRVNITVFAISFKDTACKYVAEIKAECSFTFHHLLIKPCIHLRDGSDKNYTLQGL